MRTVAIIQTRMGSTRLPGKVLMPLAGKPMLEWVVGGALRAQLLDEVVVATSNLEADDAVERFARELRVPCFRGSEEDVLDRFYQCAQAFEADVVVRLTADNPLVGAETIDRTVKAYYDRDADYVAIRPGPETGFPMGVAVEVFSMSSLAEAWKRADRGAWREHVTLYFYREGSGFRIHFLRCDRDYSSVRLTVDTQQDHAFVEVLIENTKEESRDWRKAIERAKNRRSA